MANAAITVTVEDRPDYSLTGKDQVSILLQPHPGAEPRPISKGASGGELSRVMLAIEVVLAGTDRVAVDAVGVALLRHFGTTPEVSRGAIFEQEQIARAVLRRRFGHIDGRAGLPALAAQVVVEMLDADAAADVLV